ncbi:MAG: GlsB/YeaQ/YmgE family stress response membrane protein [Halomonadaceae bacterium]|nr:MAG: GlsB/YeaQ/YmgE family stress response membrane protein [Halomonadaceae bacterium]
MNILIWLIMGGIIGWIASLIMKTEGQQGIIMNVVVGIAGSVIGGWLVVPLFGGETMQEGFNLTSFVVALVGAIILLAVVNLIRRGSPRGP